MVGELREASYGSQELLARLGRCDGVEEKTASFFRDKFFGEWDGELRQKLCAELLSRLEEGEEGLAPGEGRNGRESRVEGDGGARPNAAHRRGEYD